MHLKASQLLIVEGVEQDAHMRARIERMRPFIEAAETRHVNDEQLSAIVEEHDLNHPGRLGMHVDKDPIIILNRFRFDDSPQEQAARKERCPALFEQPTRKFSGYGGFDWKVTGTPEWHKRTGCVTQPAYQIHSIVGCPFRCAYCSLGSVYNIVMNMEQYVERLDGWIAELAGDQTLFQYDNYTDTVCFEPEYGGTELLVDYFARRERRWLELYVGKSANVDFLLPLDHRGATIACWSVSGRTQSTAIEQGTADMEARIESARKMQEAGYHVRFRLSPIIPVKNWEAENRELIERIFELTRPDVITFETLRFLDYDDIVRYLDPSLLDEEWLDIMRGVRGETPPQGGQIPDEYRRRVYRFIIDELERASPETPYAFCREALANWEFFADDFGRHGQYPDNYVCNCGRVSTPDNPIFAQAS
ncbi:MAG: spore photoproduct lyase family protein [Armatimonadota bacterium]